MNAVNARGAAAPGGPTARSRPTRRERAAQTRARMLDAAEQVFMESGYPATRMTDIADRAGVAVQTLYYTFSTKVDLLGAVVTRAVLGPEELPPPDQAFWAEVKAAGTGRALIEAFARGNLAILGRAAQVDEVVKMAKHEPEAAQMVAASEQLRRDNQGEVIALLADRFGLRTGLDVTRATDLFVLLCSTEVYLTLMRSGWSEDEYLSWVVDTLAGQLLP